MIEEHHLVVQRTARYYTLGAATQTSGQPGGQSGVLSAKTRRVWFVLHGYGQLAQYFIRRFDVVADADTVVIAPEGLSRLYTDAEFGKVGASWLTREDRDNEVLDYVTYLDQVLTSVLGDRTLDGVEVTLLGFSQGASTVCRWLEDSKRIRADRLILWAGFFPNGLRDVLRAGTVAGIPVEYVYGRADEYISQLSDVDAYLGQLQTDIPNLKLVSFEGKHVVDREVLKLLM